jgi:hypothetical protein
MIIWLLHDILRARYIVPNYNVWLAHNYVVWVDLALGRRCTAYRYLLERGTQEIT